jgi:hypothetical protein
MRLEWGKEWTPGEKAKERGSRWVKRWASL